MDSSRYGERRHSDYVAPHRGAVILTLGILGLTICFVCGIVAWVMGNEDLRSMHEGRMDRTGEGLTSAGRVCGMVGTILNAIVLVFVIIAVAAKS
jgi:hypothetical protein